MKIALLNLPIDENYGGYLQCYPLVKMFQNKKHKEMLLLIMYFFMLWMFRILPAILKRVFFRFVFQSKDLIGSDAICHNKKSFTTGLHEISIEQWLRNFNDAKFVVTDSYHGFVFFIDI